MKRRIYSRIFEETETWCDRCRRTVLAVRRRLDKSEPGIPWYAWLVDPLTALVAFLSDRRTWRCTKCRTTLYGVDAPSSPPPETANDRSVP